MNKVFENIPEDTIMIQKINDVFWLGGYHTVFDEYNDVEVSKFEPLIPFIDDTLHRDDIFNMLIDLVEKINTKKKEGDLDGNLFNVVDY